MAAGMLDPVSEVHDGERSLLALNVESAGRWPPFAEELEAASDVAVGLRTEATLTGVPVAGADVAPARAGRLVRRW